MNTAGKWLVIMALSIFISTVDAKQGRVKNGDPGGLVGQPGQSGSASESSSRTTSVVSRFMCESFGLWCK